MVGRHKQRSPTLPFRCSCKSVEQLEIGSVLVSRMRGDERTGSGDERLWNDDEHVRQNPGSQPGTSRFCAKYRVTVAPVSSRPSPVCSKLVMLSHAISLPSSASSLISLTEPLTRASLSRVKHALSHYHSHTHQGTLNDNETHAAVLIPMCNVNNRPGVLLEVRGKEMRNHSGEVRCIRIPLYTRLCCGTDRSCVASLEVESTYVLYSRYISPAVIVLTKNLY